MCKILFKSKVQKHVGELNWHSVRVTCIGGAKKLQQLFLPKCGGQKKTIWRSVEVRLPKPLLGWRWARRNLTKVRKKKKHVKIIYIRIYRNSILTQMFTDSGFFFMEIVDLLKKCHTSQKCSHSLISRYDLAGPKTKIEFTGAAVICIMCKNIRNWAQILPKHICLLLPHLKVLNSLVRQKR